MNKSTDVFWYPLRVTYSRELLLKEALDAENIENFIPMHYEYVKKADRKVRKLVPVVHNLVFVHSSLACIDRIKQSVGLSLAVRYIIDRETNRPLIVPDSQMRSFIAVSGNLKSRSFISTLLSPLYRKVTVFVSPVAFLRELKELFFVSKAIVVYQSASKELWRWLLLMFILL